MSSYSSAIRRNYTAGHRLRRTAAPKQEWVPRGSITSSSPTDTGSVPSIVQDIQDKLARGAVECMICYDMIRRSTPIWSCSTCFSIFHLNCIRKWARSPACVAADDWHCPGCQTTQSTPARDLSYTCFCGRRRDPPNDPLLSPHSCGKPCGKLLDGGGKELRCPHVCVLQCHPGPCPPCKAFAPRRKCPCGKTNVLRRCSERRSALSCQKPCDRFLGCSRHRCERVCHNGACGSCQERVCHKCFCGKKEKEVICSDVAMKGDFDEKIGLFSCDDVCGRSLLCGNHKCREKCHPGICGECELLPGKISTCHCGKKKIVDERMTCMDLIPICSNVCGKPLVCEPSIPCDEEERDRAARNWQITDVSDAFHVGENLAISDVFSDIMWRQPKRIIAIEDIFKLIVSRMPKEGSWSSMKVYAFCHIGLKHGFLMVSAYPSAYDPLIDMHPRFVVALLSLPRDAHISYLCLNDKNPMAVFSDGARVATALQRLSHGFTFQGAVMVTENVGVAAPDAARSNEDGVAVRASNSSKWTVALKLDFNEPDWREASIVVWRGNNGNPLPENANRLEED